MKHALLASLLVSAALLSPSGVSTASVDCKHRGYAHIDHHGGKLEDDRYHLMHHEKVSCEGDKHEGKADEDAKEGEHDAERLEHDGKRLEPHEHHRKDHDPMTHEHHHKF